MSPATRKVLTIGAAGVSCAALAACGTPATVKPTANPLPGLSRAIRDAQSVAAQTEGETQSLGVTNVSP